MDEFEDEEELDWEGDAPARRTRRPRRIRGRGFLLLLALIAITAGAAAWAPQFQIEDVHISGLEVTDRETAQSATKVLLGTNLLGAPYQEVEAKLKQLPAVRAARVRPVLDWPPRLAVAIEEREAFARVGSDDNWWVADREGVAFREADEGDDNLHAVTGPHFREMLKATTLGQKFSQADWSPVVKFTNELSSGDSWSVKRIYFDSDGSASVRLAGAPHDQLLIRFGPDKWTQKLQRAREALGYFRRTGKQAAELNLVSYSVPTWTPDRQDGA